MIWPDTEGGLRDWLRTQTPLTALLASVRAVWLGHPREAVEADYPLVVLGRVGGGEPFGNLGPMENVTIQFDVWGALSGAKAGREACWDAAAKLAQLVSEIEHPTLLKTGVVASGGEVASMLWFPDPVDSRPRYVLTAQITASAR